MRDAMPNNEYVMICMSRKIIGMTLYSHVVPGLLTDKTLFHIETERDLAMLENYD